MSVYIECRTNLDIDKTEVWPEILPDRPMIGDYITSVSGLELEICRVSWDRPKRDVINNRVEARTCTVEMKIPTHRFACMEDFEIWYRSRKNK